MPAFALLLMMNSLAVPAGAVEGRPPFDLADRTVLARFQAEGAQVYECRSAPSDRAAGSGAGAAPAWALREPIATLMEGGKTVGRHFAGPHWALDDGSLVEGHLLESRPGAESADIPLLRLEVARNAGAGRLAAARYIYRLNTRGGVLQGPCDHPGALRAVPYAADYLFAR